MPVGAARIVALWQVLAALAAGAESGGADGDEAVGFEGGLLHEGAGAAVVGPMLDGDLRELGDRLGAAGLRARSARHRRDAACQTQRPLARNGCRLPAKGADPVGGRAFGHNPPPATQGRKVRAGGGAKAEANGTRKRGHGPGLWRASARTLWSA